MPRPSSAINAGERAASNMKRVVGENIKARRIALDLSQEELAEKFGVSRTALSQYEIGVGEVNAGNLPRLASILGISTLKFFEQPAEAYYSDPDEADRRSLARAIQRVANQKHVSGNNPNIFALLEVETAPSSQEAMPQSQSLSDLMLQIAQLTDEDQETVRRMVSALHSARTLPASTNIPGRAKLVAKRVSKKR